MISTYDVIKEFRKAEKENKGLSLKLSEDEKNLIDVETGEFFCTVEDFTQAIRRDKHCDFEVIYSEHVSLDVFYRCKECGTVIFSGDDEYRYDPNLRCPICCKDDSVCHVKYWTKEEIESDIEKQKQIETLIEFQAMQDRREERYFKRGGLYDWQRWVKRIHLKNHEVEISYINFGFDGDTNKTRKPADKSLEISISNNKDYICKTHIVPLSFHSFYLRYIYPYSKKCPEEWRHDRRFPWSGVLKLKLKGRYNEKLNKYHTKSQ